MYFSESALLEIRDFIAKAEKICIVAHKSPDGDALGSTLGLRHYLNSIGKVDVQVIMPDAFPKFLDYLPGSESILIHESAPELVSEVLHACDVLFCLDFNHPGRVGDMEALLREVSQNKTGIMLDHHQQPEPFLTFIGSETSASSTCEMVYHFCRSLGMPEVPTREMAICIYTGLMTDTGSFRFSATTPETHKVAARLLESGIRHWEIHEHIFNQNSLNKLKLWGYALNQKLVYLQEYRTAYIGISASELNQFNYQEGDLEGLVNYALSIEGVTMGVLMTERKDRIRISFRSVGDFSVNAFSRAHFEGGGHTNAAGGVFLGTLESAVERLKNVLPEFRQQLISKRS